MVAKTNSNRGNINWESMKSNTMKNTHRHHQQEHGVQLRGELELHGELDHHGEQMLQGDVQEPRGRQGWCGR